MPPITVNWSDLEIAFERNSPDQESFLDLENGDLLSIVEGEPDAAARRARGRQQPRSATCGSTRRRRASSTAGWSASWPRCPTAAARAAAHRHRRQGRVPPLQGRAAGLPGRARALVRLPRRAAALAHPDLARAHEDRGRRTPPPWGQVAQPAEPPEMPRAGPVGRGARRDPAPPGARADRRDPGGRAAGRRSPSSSSCATAAPARCSASVRRSAAAPSLDDHDDDDDDDDDHTAEPAVGVR